MNNVQVSTPDRPDEVPTGLPPGWLASTPGPDDVDELVRLVNRHEEHARGWPSTATVDVAAQVTGRGAEVRRHLLTRDAAGHARGWATVHDRAAGRVLLSVDVDPDLPDELADRTAGNLLAWSADAAAQIGADRGLRVTQMDCGAFAEDERQHRWLSGAGFEQTRRWWQMSRPVAASEGQPGALPPPREGVVIRRVRHGFDGLPEEADVRTVHDVLEASFADHFNSHAESFDEFCSRLREDPGHRWDHWWIAELDGDADDPTPAGALVASALPAGTTPDGTAQGAGSYVDYIGVLQTARGRGVAKSLLYAVIADAAHRGRSRVGLEVDADSPTGADSLYTAMGWETSYVTESWHRDISISP